MQWIMLTSADPALVKHFKYQWCEGVYIYFDLNDLYWFYLELYDLKASKLRHIIFASLSPTLAWPHLIYVENVKVIYVLWTFEPMSTYIWRNLSHFRREILHQCLEYQRLINLYRSSLNWHEWLQNIISVII